MGTHPIFLGKTVLLTIYFRLAFLFESQKKRNRC